MNRWYNSGCLSLFSSRSSRQTVELCQQVVGPGPDPGVWILCCGLQGPFLDSFGSFGAAEGDEEQEEKRRGLSQGRK